MNMRHTIAAAALLGLAAWGPPPPVCEDINRDLVPCYSGAAVYNHIPDSLPRGYAPAYQPPPEVRHWEHREYGYVVHDRPVPPPIAYERPVPAPVPPPPIYRHWEPDPPPVHDRIHERVTYERTHEWVMDHPHCNEGDSCWYER